MLAACDGQSARLGIRLFTEEANTSGFLQSLDQYNSAFHRRYQEGRDVYKKAYLAHYGTELSHITLIDFLKVLGGDATVGVPGMWFSWAHPFDIITAWRRVGIAGNRLVPGFIPRAEFIDQPDETGGAAPAASPPRKRAAELALTPG